MRMETGIEQPKAGKLDDVEASCLGEDYSGYYFDTPLVDDDGRAIKMSCSCQFKDADGYEIATLSGSDWQR